MRPNLTWLQCFLAMVASATALSAQSRELPAPADTLPAAVRDSVLNAVVDEFALTNHIGSPSIAEHTYLSPYRGIGFADTLAAHASAPMVLPNGLVLVTMYHYSESAQSWGLATTPVYLTRLHDRWSPLCHGVSIYDDGSR